MDADLRHYELSQMGHLTSVGRGSRNAISSISEGTEQQVVALPTIREDSPRFSASIHRLGSTDADRWQRASGLSLPELSKGFALLPPMVRVKLGVTRQADLVRLVLSKVDAPPRPRR